MIPARRPLATKHEYGDISSGHANPRPRRELDQEEITLGTGIEISTLLALILGLTVVLRCQARTDVPPSQSATQGSPQSPKAGSAVYLNYRHGFRIYLPKGWKGFTVIESKWQGTNHSTGDTQDGPLIRIKYPLYAEQNPREDIPIMVIRRDQWREINTNQLIVSAAPVPPGAIGRNEKYVLATPPRYSFDELDGVNEVVKIMNSKSLQPLRVTQAQ